MKQVYVYLEGNDFKYDIRALLKALYPTKKIVITVNIVYKRYRYRL